MYNIFNDNSLQKSFEDDGYVTLPKILVESEVEELKKIYLQFTNGNVKNTVYGMFVSLDELDAEKKIELIKTIQQYLKPNLDKYLHDIKVHLGAYLVKVPNPQSYTYPHQDWLFVDNFDKELFSATIWVSLEDIDINMGSLGFIKGSHKFLNNIVGSPSPEIITATMGHEALILSYLTFPKISKGDAVIFNNKTVHAAFPNKTDKQRIAVGIGISPTPAVLYHYFLNPNNPEKIYKLTVEEEFFYTYGNDSLRKTFQNKELPKHTKVVDELDYNPKLYSKEEIEQIMIENGNVPNNIPIEKLFANIPFSVKVKYALKYALGKFFK